MAVPLKLAANIVGISAVVIATGYILNSTFAAETAQKCEARYAGATEFSFRNEEGQKLTPIELQARMGLSEWGVLENAKIVEAKNGSSPDALEISIAKGTGSGFNPTVPRGGVSFRWGPAEMTKASAACLHYRVWLPEDFDFASNGMLPGLFGGKHFEPRQDAVKGEGFGTRVAWGNEGKLAVMVQVPTDEGWQDVPLARSSTKMRPGHWHTIEQELVLNTPGKDNGIVRIWADGKLLFENSNNKFREDDTLTIGGILADIGYGALFSTTAAPKDTVVRLSPLSVRWQ